MCSLLPSSNKVRRLSILFPISLMMTTLIMTFWIEMMTSFSTLCSKPMHLPIDPSLLRSLHHHVVVNPWEKIVSEQILMLFMIKVIIILMTPSMVMMTMMIY